MTLLQSMEATLSWGTMVNRHGTTWRALPDTIKSSIDRDSALKLMLENPAIIKRPILATSNHFFIGFTEQKYHEIFS